MAEQSHKREMNDALRGDFERLRARRQRAPRPELRADASERVVLTPPRQLDEPEPPAVEPARDAVTTGDPDAEPAPAPRRSWLGALRRRR
jgi:hypothetical protein